MVDFYNWLNQWEHNDIPFHRPIVNPHLEKYWSQLDLPLGCQILVPLCGKSLDLLWIKNQRYSVIGSEISPIACQAFFTENKLAFTLKPETDFVCYRSEGITLYCGDFFQLHPSMLPKISAIYDRAALMALPAELRPRYAKHLTHFLSAGGQILLVLIDSPNSVEGPPYVVSKQEVNQLFSTHFQIKELARVKIKELSPSLFAKGYREAFEVVYLLDFCKGKASTTGIFYGT